MTRFLTRRRKLGVALDVEISMRVFGWTWQKIGFHWDRRGEMYLVDDPAADWVLNTTSGNWTYFENDAARRVSYDMLQYSDDAADAFHIVRKLNERGFWFILGQDWGGNWNVRVAQRDKPLVETMWYPSLALAICDAALEVCP